MNLKQVLTLIAKNRLFLAISRLSLNLKVELIKTLVDEYGNWEEYTKAVMTIENEQASQQTINKVYDYCVSNSISLLNPEIDDLIAQEDFSLD